ncbi:hypothetical protein [Thauera aminoaromatica]|jgi:hypothetical protein|uniref:Transcriptional regulator n=3 Tax=Thauera aminoaromatica TaxID=164330 RepID=C4KA94_THASP|nr:hypothetical protein [Thauera aminoaromatica]ACR01320.1 conserved hypothetical protein [Thauera aminoaromatica]ENO86203.1 hypothetical protein C665_08125 [Thauera aminoaromatica S2]MCK6399446.1 hypothetical protein [Thauera aminoaromatica]TXH77931.1 MAG: hypothetical protein E6Q80_23855 [Thauera aminoaromatica]HMV93730.1 hypothetical protein [Thauera aminoaromatica]
MTIRSATRYLAGVVLCAGLALGAHAGTPEEDATLGLIREQFQDVDLRRVIEVSASMKLDEQGAKRFWPIYRAYLAEIVALRDRQIDTLAEYARQLDAGWIDDPTARTSLARSLALEQARVDARHHMIRKAGEVITPIQTLRLYQLELAMDASIGSRVLQQIPLAK